jgi:uncharacterized protein YukE
VLLPDTSALRSQARQLDAEADDLSDRSRRLRAVADQVRWVSLAASRYRAEADGMCNDLDGVVAALHRAAHGLRAHADSADRIVQAAVAVPGEAVRAGEQVAADGVDRVRSLLGLR